MLVADGSSSPVVAFSYLVAAGRERARLGARRGRVAVGATAAALSLLGAGTALLAPTAQASPVHAVQARVTEPLRAVSQLSDALGARHLRVRVVGQAVGPALVGSVLSVRWKLPGPVPIRLLYGPCPGLGALTCTVGVSVPTDLAAPAEVVVGARRTAQGHGISSQARP